MCCKGVLGVKEAASLLLLVNVKVLDVTKADTPHRLSRLSPFLEGPGPLEGAPRAPFGLLAGHCLALARISVRNGIPCYAVSWYRQVPLNAANIQSP